MPIKGDAKKVLKSMKKQYGDKEGESVFYATANKQDRTPETWKKKKKEALYRALRKNSAYYMEEEEDERPGFLSSVLGGTALGTGLGGLAHGGLEYFRGRGDYDEALPTLQRQFSDAAGTARGNIMGGWRDTAFHDRFNAAETADENIMSQVPTRHQFGWERAKSAIPGGAIKGAILGGSLGLLRYLLGR